MIEFLWSNSNNLRQLQEEDLAIILQWRNDDKIRHFMFNSDVIALADHQAWFQRTVKDESKHLLIFEKNKFSVGFAQLSVLKGGVAEWGFYVDPSSPRGTGQQMALNVLQYSFESLNLHKISARVIDFNQRSLHLHNKFFFTEEGVLRDEHYDGVKYHNVICFGLLKNEWKNKVTSNA